MSDLRKHCNSQLNENMVKNINKKTWTLKQKSKNAFNNLAEDLLSALSTTHLPMRPDKMF